MAKESAHQEPAAVIKRGNVVIPIREGFQLVKGRRYPQFRFEYSLEGRRKTRRFADLEKAKKEAEKVALKIASGEQKVLQLTGTDQTAYVHAIQALKTFGIPLTVAMDDYVEALKALPKGKTLREAVEFYQKRNPDNFQNRRLSEVIADLVAAKETASRSEIYIKDMRSRLGQFSKAFPNTNIGAISGPMIQKFINGLKLGGRTKQNHLRHITSLFNFAVKRKYLPKDSLEELEAIEWPEQEHKDIQVFTPAELREMLPEARPEILPFLCIGAFAGLRTAEIHRLDWSDVHLDERFIEVSADKAKTASRRTVPIVDCLYEWLQPFAESKGPITPFENMAKQISWLVRDINKRRKADGNTSAFRWKHNGLRHSFISYRLAIIKDVAQVALDCGNSPQMIFKHYRQLVRPKEAEAWFAITPPASGENIIPFIQAENS